MLAILSRKNFETEFDKLACRPDEGRYAVRKSGFINSVLFEAWPERVLFGDIEDTRNKIAPMTTK
jgi:hypothetical protein